MIYFNDNNTPKQQNEAQKKQQDNSDISDSNDDNTDAEQYVGVCDDDYWVMFNKNAEYPIVGSFELRFTNPYYFFYQPEQDNNLIEPNSDINSQVCMN